MKAVRIVALAFGALVVLYFLLINFVPDWMIVGVRFRWPVARSLVFGLVCLVCLAALVAPILVDAHHWTPRKPKR